MRLSNIEVRNQIELHQTLIDIPGAPSQYNIAVECLLFDNSGKWILMKRGPKCRDEIGKLEGIGGRVEKDEEFLDALQREILEEVGDKAEIQIVRFFEIRKDAVEDVNWVIISYLCILRAGELIICEPLKNSGFVRLNINKVDRTKLSSSANSALTSIQGEWEKIKELINKY